jgi:chromosome segregation ATPase
MFLTLQEKLNSPVFNGGFDKLLMKVDAIENSQKQTSELISTINKTIYEPDDGLYSRIKNVEKLNSDKLTALAAAQEQLKEDLSEMKTTLKEGVQIASDLKDLQNEVDDLKEWKSGLNRKLWILIPAFVTAALKIGWDIVASHLSWK